MRLVMVMVVVPMMMMMVVHDGADENGNDDR